MSRAKGLAKENDACDWLRKQGMKLIAQNYLCRGGEIDIIGQHAAALIFVEVRFRSSLQAALESVDTRKQKKLIIAAKHFLAQNPAYANQIIRFDVIAITPEADQPNWIQNAFNALD